MGNILRSSFFNHVLSKEIWVGIFVSITLANPLNGQIKQEQLLSFFEQIENDNLISLKQFFAELKQTRSNEAACKRFLDDFLAEFNHRYQTNITKKEWKLITIRYIQENASHLLCEPLVLEKIESLLELKQIQQSFFKNCDHRRGYEYGRNGEIDDHIVLGGVGLLVSGLIGTLGLVFPPALGVAGAIATYSLYEITEGVKKQSEINRTNPNPYPRHSSFSSRDNKTPCCFIPICIKNTTFDRVKAA